MTTTIYIEVTTTERRTYLGGISEAERKELLAKGFKYDRLANQYRRTARAFDTYQDGVVVPMTGNQEVA